MQSTVTAEASRLFREPPRSLLVSLARYLLAGAVIWGAGCWFILQDPLRLEIARVGMVIATASLVLLHIDRRRTAAWVLVLSCWLLAAESAALTAKGAINVPYTAMMVPILLSGLILGLRAAFLIALASAALGFLIGPMNLVPSVSGGIVESTAISRWFGDFVLFSAAFGLAAFAIRRVQIVLLTLEKSEATREQRNEALRAEIRQREQVEAQLRLSEEHHRRVSEMSSDLTFKWTLVEGQPPAQEWLFGPCEEITGWKPEELDAERWTSIVISGDEESFAERHRESFALDKNDSEFRIRRKDGETRWISQQLRVVRHEDRLELFGAARDITKRKLAENALGSDRHFISALLDNAAVMFAVLDRDTRIVRINESAAKFAGRSVQELLGTHALTHLPGD